MKKVLDGQECITASYYICVKDMTQDLTRQLREELDKLLLTYRILDHDVTVTQVHF